MDKLIELSEKMNGSFAVFALALMGGVVIIYCVSRVNRTIIRKQEMEYQQVMDLKKIDGPKQITQRSNQQEG